MRTASSQTSYTGPWELPHPNSQWRGQYRSIFWLASTSIDLSPGLQTQLAHVLTVPKTSQIRFIVERRSVTSPTARAEVWPRTSVKFFLGPMQEAEPRARFGVRKARSKRLARWRSKCLPTTVEKTGKTCEFRAKNVAYGKTKHRDFSNRDDWNTLFKEMSEMCGVPVSRAIDLILLLLLLC